jgi:hypothetical protein
MRIGKRGSVGKENYSIGLKRPRIEQRKRKEKHRRQKEMHDRMTSAPAIILILKLAK